MVPEVPEIVMVMVMVMVISTNPIANDAIRTSHSGSSSSTIVCDEHFREVSAVEVKLVSS